MKKFEKEHIQAFVCALISLAILLSISFHDIFISKQTQIEQLILYVLSFFIALIGVVLGALALLVSFFSSKIVEAIKKERVEKILKSFYTIAKNMGYFIVAFIWLYFILLSNYQVFPALIFYIFTFIYIYFFYYSIFYVIDLIRNINILFDIKNGYEKIERKVNENNTEFLLFIQEYILKKMVETGNINLKNMKQEMESLIEDFYKETETEKKENIRKALYNYFDWNEETT